MAMEDILKALVESRQQGGTSHAAADPMADLIGNLLGGTQSQTQAPANPNAGGTDLSGMMGLLETFMGGQNNASAGAAAGDPVMMLISPFVPSLAKKANVSPEIAMIVISFVVHKLLAHHPTSGRDSNSFNLDEMLGQMSSGRVDTGLLQQSGMINELSRKTGLDEAATEQVLQLAFAAVGKTVGGMVAKSGSSKPSSAGSAVKSARGGKSLGNSGAKRGGNKIEH